MVFNLHAHNSFGINLLSTKPSPYPYRAFLTSNVHSHESEMLRSTFDTNNVLSPRTAFHLHSVHQSRLIGDLDDPLHINSYNPIHNYRATKLIWHSENKLKRVIQVEEESKRFGEFEDSLGESSTGVGDGGRVPCEATRLVARTSVVGAAIRRAGNRERASFALEMETHEVRCKRRISFAYGAGGQQTASVARRNARERNRVKQVNNGFATLRAHIPVSVTAALGGQTQRPAPGSAASKKLSKVETLRMAVEYIRSLQQLLDGHVSSTTPPPSSSSPVSMPSPRCSEASSSPPPSSYNSDSAPGQTSVPSYHHYHHVQPMSPEDEELLDVISWWQQTQ
ncbi:hypothetical protein LSTR_LSTR004064 [Laodelphax striatellus]|uniref:BHLH domain-containing protein n=1 Tax=Laodelphax striatellus TaxID=195883 RepID=A0A482WG94_LAOST|nr:hypothetical protein LSTR_LSTR004064 [Laodelphax striatellus]